MLKYKIIIPIIIFAIILVSYAFIMISNYAQDAQYISSLPTVEVSGFLTDEGNDWHDNLKYSVLTGYGPSIGTRYYLQDKDIDPQLVGEYVRINGYLENDYEGTLIRDGFDLVDHKIVRVIYIKELEIRDSPGVP